MSKKQQEAPMPAAYRTPSGRVVTANPALHRMVVEQKGKYGSYAPCDDSGRVEAGAHGEEAMSLSAEAAEHIAEKAKQEGIEQGWAEAKQSLGEAIEEAKAAAFEEGKAAGAKEAEAAASNKASPKTKAADK